MFRLDKVHIHLDCDIDVDDHIFHCMAMERNRYARKIEEELTFMFKLLHSMYNEIIYLSNSFSFILPHDDEVAVVEAVLVVT